MGVKLQKRIFDRNCMKFPDLLRNDVYNLHSMGRVGMGDQVEKVILLGIE